jgi:hypothetical protein
LLKVLFLKSHFLFLKGWKKLLKCEIIPKNYS